MWFDALLNYITAIGLVRRRRARFTQLWPANVQLIGKEIARFHTIIWPAILWALGRSRPELVFAHGWITVDGQKMGKSLGNAVDPFVLAERFGADSLRYFLLREAPFGSDFSYSEEKIAQRHNSDLGNDLGNLLQRTLSMLQKYRDGVVPAPQRRRASSCSASRRLPQRVRALIFALDFRGALEAIWELVTALNRAIDERKPWALSKEGRDRELDALLYDLCEGLRWLAILLHPFMPERTAEMWRQLGLRGGIGDDWARALRWGGTRARHANQCRRRALPAHRTRGERVAPMSERNAPSRAITVGGGIVAVAGLAVALTLYARAVHASRLGLHRLRRRSRCASSRATRCRCAACACAAPAFRPKRSFSICRSPCRSSHSAARSAQPRARLRFALGFGCASIARDASSVADLPRHGVLRVLAALAFLPFAATRRNCRRFRSRKHADRRRHRRAAVTSSCSAISAPVSSYTFHLSLARLWDAARARSAHVGRHRRRRDLGDASRRNEIVHRRVSARDRRCGCRSCLSAFLLRTIDEQHAELHRLRLVRDAVQAMLGERNPLPQINAILATLRVPSFDETVSVLLGDQRAHGFVARRLPRSARRSVPPATNSAAAFWRA